MAVGPNKERVDLESGAKAPRGLRIMPAALLHYLKYKILKNKKVRAINKSTTFRRVEIR